MIKKEGPRMSELSAQLMRRSFAILPLALAADIGIVIAIFAGQSASEKPAPPAATQVPKEKQTVLGLYITSKEAYEKWKAQPDQVKIIDVRTPEEYLFVGHPSMAWKNPLAVQTFEWDAEKKQFPLKPLPDFVSRVSEVANPDDMLLVICRSGTRSAVAVNLLAKAGFKTLYNVTDGMEGDSVEDPRSVFVGQRLVNGWNNSGCPWTYHLTPDRMVLPKVR
jgi:rhodanese-related sulfurtransferase